MKKVRTILLALCFLSPSAFAETPKGISIQHEVEYNPNYGTTIRTQENRNIPVFTQLQRNSYSAIYSYQRNGALELRIYPTSFPKDPFCKVEIKESDLIPNCELTSKKITFRHHGSAEPRCFISEPFCVTK